MEFKIIRNDASAAAVLTPGTYRVNDTQDILDLMGNAPERSIIISRESINQAFFDLGSRLAGDILQKISNYNIRLGITGDFSEGSSSLRAFISESNRNGQVVFAATAVEALQKFRFS